MRRNGLLQVASETGREEKTEQICMLPHIPERKEVSSPQKNSFESLGENELCAIIEGKLTLRSNKRELVKKRP